MDDKTRSILRRCLQVLEEPLETRDLRQELQELLTVEEEPTVLLTDALAAFRMTSTLPTSPLTSFYRSGSRPLSSAMAASIYAAVAAVLGRADAEITIREAESACELRLLSQRNFGRKRLWILRETIKGVTQ